MANVDCFLKIDGITGESADDKHKGEIEVQSFSWAIVNKSTSSSGGGGGAGKVHVGDFFFEKLTDVSSPKLLEALTTGKHITTAVLSCRKQGGSQQEYLKVTLTDVLVSRWLGVALNGTGSVIPGAASHFAHADGNLPVPAESVQLNFGKIELEYREQDSKGNMLGPVKTVWNVKANKAS
jgi:type VI secretion system secreted protein Hcp